MQRRELGDKLEYEVGEDLGEEGPRGGDMEDTTACWFLDEDPRDDSVDDTMAIDDTYT